MWFVGWLLFIKPFNQITAGISFESSLNDRANVFVEVGFKIEGLNSVKCLNK